VRPLDFIRHHYDVAGLRGVAVGSCHRVLKFPKKLKIRPSDFRAEIQLRLGTTDTDVYKEVIAGEYDFDLPFEPKTILDAGANVGITSVWFANRYPAAKIYAVEAERSNFEALVLNAKPYSSIIPIHAALWNRNGTIVVSSPQGRHGGHYAFVTHDSGEGTTIPAVTMKSLMEELKIATIDIAKIDIEGAEIEVFKDSEWLRSIRSVMIELHDRFRPGCTELVDRSMKDFDKLHCTSTTFYVRR
jgi:FkbM family methyltransferase